MLEKCFRMGKIAILLLAVLFLSLVSIQAQATAPQEGGTLRIALTGEPPNLDILYSTLNFIRNVGCHIYENLFEFDENYEPTAFLADSYEISDDGLTHTYYLRQGIKFHNGQEMTSKDVVASLERWMAKSGFGQRIGEFSDSLVSLDRYTVKWTFTAPINLVEMSLASWRQGAVIQPASIIEEAGTKVLTESQYVGTGPYRFVKWEEGQSILLERFEDYQPLDSPPSGYAGRRIAYVDQLEFLIIPEDAVRRIGVETGDWDIALAVSRESYERYEADPMIQSIVGGPRMLTLILNKAQGAFSNLLLRRAAQAAICVDEILTVYGPETFWRVDPSITWEETAWWSDAGSEFYNVCEPEYARQLLKWSGFEGTIRIIVRSTDKSKLDASLLVEQQLEQVGFNVEIDVRDPAAQSAIIHNPDGGWDLEPNEHTYRTHPILHSYLKDTYEGWWVNEGKNLLQNAMLLAGTSEEAFAILEEIQKLFYEDVCAIKIGDFFEYHITRKAVRGFANMPEPFFWNVWLEEE